jgi:hypothetical protein
VYLQPATACTNAVLHGWLKKELTAILARLPMPSEPVDAAVTRAAWQVWQDGLTAPFTLPEQLPPLPGQFNALYCQLPGAVSVMKRTSS